MAKAKPNEVKAYFEEGSRKVETKEILRLKKSADGQDLPDYDQIAEGIGNGTLTY